MKPSAEFATLYQELRRLKRSTRQLKTIGILLLALDLAGAVALLLLREHGRFMF